MWQDIAALNFEIGEREFRKDIAYFNGLLAPAFAMQRANPERTIVDRGQFLHELGTADPKARVTEVDSMSLVGHERLIVTCVVTMDNRRYRNVRVFVVNRNPNASNADQKWLLLAWLNEPLP
jgi:hypothetical protein